MRIRLENVVRLPIDLQALTAQRDALQSKILEEASKTPQLTELAANQLILDAVQKYLPQTTNAYNPNQSFSTFDALLTMAISQFDGKRPYAFTRFFVSNQDTMAYNELSYLQARLNNTTIIKAETLAKAETPVLTSSAEPTVCFSAPKKAAPPALKPSSDLAANLHEAFKKRAPLDLKTIEKKLEIATKERTEKPVDTETLPEVRLKNQLKKAAVESRNDIAQQLEAAKKAREQHPLYANHLQNLRNLAHKIQPSIVADDDEAEKRAQQFKKLRA
jgi:hypothetical protein